MKIIALLGGVACGKSTVAKYLSGKGAVVICVDKIAHETLSVPEVREQMYKRWHDKIAFSSGAELFRKQVADLVFKDRNELAFLEHITWPFMRRAILQRIGSYHPLYTKIVVLDFPLFMESNFGEDIKSSYKNYRMDGSWETPDISCWFVDTPESRRLENFINRRKKEGVQETVEEAEFTFRAREKRQYGPDTKRAACDVIIENDGTDAIKLEIDKALGASRCLLANSLDTVA